MKEIKYTKYGKVDIFSIFWEGYGRMLNINHPVLGLFDPYPKVAKTMARSM